MPHSKYRVQNSKNHPANTSSIPHGVVLLDRMRIDIYIHDAGLVPPKHSCEGRFEHAVLNRLERIMADLAQLNALLVTIGDEVGKVSADTDNLLAQLQAIPPGGLTPEQQAAIDTAVASAQGIAERLQAIDQKVPDAPPPANP